MTAASTFDVGWAADVKRVRFDFWDVNQNSSVQGFNFRFFAPGLISAGYTSDLIIRDSAGAATAGGITTSWFVDGISGLGLSRGFFEAYLADEASDEWNAHGEFHDDFDDDVIKFFGSIDLGANAVGMRFNSGNATNYTAGFFSLKTWT